MSGRDETELSSAEIIGAEQLAAAGNWEIGEARVSFGTLLIQLGERKSRLAPKAMGVLLALARNPGETLSRDQLLDMVWPGDYPTQDVLSHAIRELRRALGDQMPNPVRIQTIPRIGYRLVALARRIEDPGEPVAPDVDGVDRQEAAFTLQAELESELDDTRLQPRSVRTARWMLGVLGLLFILLAGMSVIMRPHSPVRPERVAGQSPKLLTSSLQAERMPTVTSDGRRYAYTEWVGDSGVTRIVAATMDGHGHAIVSVPERQQNFYPQWSRDGSMLAFQSSTEGNCGISLLMMNGLEVTGRRFLGGCNSEVYDLFNWAVGDRGLWLSRPRLPNGRVTQLLLRDLEGKDHWLDYDRNAEDFDRDPRQSPDGRWIAFRRGVHPRGALFMVASEGGAVQRLTRSQGYFGRFDWYPDSRHLLYSRKLHEQTELFRLDTRTLEQEPLGIHDADSVDIAEAANLAVFERLRVRLRIREYSLVDPSVGARWIAPSTGTDLEAVYAPDASRIALISDRSGSTQVWMTPAQEDAPVQLTRFGGELLHDLSFSQDGNELLWISSADRVHDQVCVLDIVQSATKPACRSMAHAELRSPRRLPNTNKIVYSGMTEAGWRAFVIDLGQPEESLQTIDVGGIDPHLEVRGSDIYLTDPARAEILVSEPPYQRVRVVVTDLVNWQSSRWHLAGDAIWYAWINPEIDHFQVYRAAIPGPMRAETALDLGEGRNYPLLDISRDARRVLVRTQLADETDIAVIGLDE